MREGLREIAEGSGATRLGRALVMEALADDPQQIFDPIGFLQHPKFAERLPLAQLRGWVAGGEQHLQPRPAASCLACEFLAVHAPRHDDIAEQQIDVVLAVDNFQCFGPSPAVNTR